MTPEKEGKERFAVLRDLLKSDDPVVGFVRDIAVVLAIVGGIALFLFLASGTWPAVVAVESESMIPNMQVGDLVFLAAPDHAGGVITWEEGQYTGYAPFASSPDLQGNMPYGDVIIYRPNNDASVHPIIHRALVWYNATPHAGYLTKGDHNPVMDQQTYLAGVGALEPVMEEWVIGKALFAIPLVGYLPLHLFEFAFLVIALMIIHELWLRRRKEEEKPPSRGGKKR